MSFCFSVSGISEAVLQTTASNTPVNKRHPVYDAVVTGVLLINGRSAGKNLDDLP